MTAAEQTETPPATGGLAERLSNLSDRCNPILVREIQQSMRSKAFVITLSVALASIVVTALVVAGEGRTGSAVGQDYVAVALNLLTPIVLFLIPLQACLSMQHEVRGGTGEQLLMSRLTPRQIVRGKLLAAMVQFCLFASVFGPLLALTFLLRGVDVPTIVFFMVAGALCCLVASALAIAVGAVGRARILTTFLLAGTAVLLGFLSIGIMSSLWYMVREISSDMRRGEFWLFMLLAANVLVLALLLFGMIASALLSHPNENRSTPFRVFPFVAMIVGAIWLVCAAPPRELSEASRYFAIFATVGLTPFWWFAVTEDPELSPRARTMVPRSKAMALLAAPLLPGGGRGVAFIVLSSALLFALAFGLELLGRARGFSAHSSWPRWETIVMCWGYCAGYTMLGRLLRGRMPAGALASKLARSGVAAMVMLGCVVPLFVDIMINGHVAQWSWLHITNPFWTMDTGQRDEAFVAVLACALVVTAVNLPAMYRGVREVLEASRDRRQRHAS